MVREAEFREALKYSLSAGQLKSHVREWLEQQGKPADDESVINAIVERAMQHYHVAVGMGAEWQVDTADKLLKQVDKGKSNFWKLTYAKATNNNDFPSQANTATAGEKSEGGLNPAAYLLLLLGPIGWIIFFIMWSGSKK